MTGIEIFCFCYHGPYFWSFWRCFFFFSLQAFSELLLLKRWITNNNSGPWALDSSIQKSFIELSELAFAKVKLVRRIFLEQYWSSLRVPERGGKGALASASIPFLIFLLKLFNSRFYYSSLAKIEDFRSSQKYLSIIGLVGLKLGHILIK